MENIIRYSLVSRALSPKLWLIVTYSNSLVNRVYKGKYFNLGCRNKAPRFRSNIWSNMFEVYI